MNFEEHVAKSLMAEAGIAVPAGRLCESPEAVEAAAADLGPCAVKAQVPSGKRGKAGGIALAADPAEAKAAAARILGMEIAGHHVERLLVEQQVPIARELYLALLNDPASKGPLLLVGAEGGMDIEELAASRPDRVLRRPIDVLSGPDEIDLTEALAGLGLDDLAPPLAGLIGRLYGLYLESDAELLEINPLAVTEEGGLIALDGKLTLDPSATPRQEALAARASPERPTALEARGAALGLKYIELEGSVGVLANGAGLTMTTMDAVRHYGGEPANFLEIGGDAYTLGRPALELVLSNPRVTALLVNFCGAFARTDVMTAGILEAWDSVQPQVPVFFSIHGTGEDEAVAMVREKLGVEAYDLMDDAVQAAVAAAEAASGRAGAA